MGGQAQRFSLAFALQLRKNHGKPSVRVAEKCRSPDGARIVHHGTDELPVEQNTVPDGEATPPVWERTQYPQSLGSFLSNLVDVR